jgi:uncharacterized protein (TIGR01244 family)
MRPTLALAAFLSAAVLHGGQVPDAVDPALIPAYKVIAPGLAAAGQPVPDALARLGTWGFKTVLNLRLPNEGGPANERSVVESQGLRYVSIPVTSASLSLDDLAAIEKVLDDPAAAPVLFHCASSNRVGGVWAAIQVRKKKSLDAALAAGREAGLRSTTMEDAVRRLVAPKAP